MNPTTQQLEILSEIEGRDSRIPLEKLKKNNEQSHYYPFGMEQENPRFAKNNGEYKYKYQAQERQDELGLNWDSFKWRNYDYALGRFMSVDPLAEDYPYNSTYAFQENKMGMGRELEGLELYNDPGLKKFMQNMVDYMSMPFKLIDKGYASFTKTDKKIISTTKLGNASLTTSVGSKKTITVKSNFMDFFTNHNNSPLIKMTDIFTLSTSITSFVSNSVEGVVAIKGIPVNVGTKETTSSDGSEKIEATASLGNGDSGKIGLGIGLIKDSEGNNHADTNLKLSTPELKNNDNSKINFDIIIGIKKEVEK